MVYVGGELLVVGENGERVGGHRRSARPCGRCDATARGDGVWFIASGELSVVGEKGEREGWWPVAKRDGKGVAASRTCGYRKRVKVWVVGGQLRQPTMTRVSEGGASSMVGGGGGRRRGRRRLEGSGGAR